MINTTNMNEAKDGRITIVEDTVGLTDTQLRATPVPISGSIETDIVLAEYATSDWDVVSGVIYVGNLADDGAYYIMQVDTANKTVRYYKGASGYATAWGNRLILAYDHFNDIF